MSVKVQRRAKRSVALMREFYSQEGIDSNTAEMLKSLGLTATITLQKPWTRKQKRNLIGVLLTTAFQVGRSQTA